MLTFAESSCNPGGETEGGVVGNSSSLDNIYFRGRPGRRADNALVDEIGEGGDCIGCACKGNADAVGT